MKKEEKEMNKLQHVDTACKTEKVKRKRLDMRLPKAVRRVTRIEKRKKDE